jgi:hypothetical protein
MMAEKCAVGISVIDPHRSHQGVEMISRGRKRHRPLPQMIPRRSVGQSSEAGGLAPRKFADRSSGGKSVWALPLR